MTLVPGTTLGPYEIGPVLGAGGMGEVYRARDTRLDRTVAVKVLPSHLSSDPALRQRFEREARAVSSLNHPNICVLYDVGQQEGTDYLVMEYLEGETLAHRLEKGAIPLGQALRCAIEIADALEKAHRRGVIHRDLKPGNIMLTASGAKILDFGLAKSTGGLASGIALSATPTESSPLTAEGTIIGTIHYMSPEQLEGKEADARSDLFSFGAVLYEMVTGTKAFPGKSRFSVASAILEKEPEPVSNLQPSSPPALEYVLRTCLAKDPEDRFQTAQDVKLQLKWIAEQSSTAVRQAFGAWAGRPSRRTHVLWGGVSLVLASAAALVSFWLGAARSNAPSSVTHFAIVLGDRQVLAADSTLSVSLSPDGKKLAYVAAESGVSHLYLRPLDQFDATLIPESEGATFPFFSDDSQWLAFFSEGRLKKVPVAGGTPTVICQTPSFLGGTWLPDDTILLTIPGMGFATVPASGGTPQKVRVSSAGKFGPAGPVALPGGEWALFTNYAATDRKAYAVRVRTGEARLLVSDAQGPYYALGHLLYFSGGRIWSIPFDPGKLAVQGAAVALTNNVDEHSLVGQFSASRTGVLVYAPALSQSSGRNLFWVSRDGTARKIEVAPEDYVDPSIAPDGKRFVIAVRRVSEQALAVYDVQRGVLMRMSSNGARHAAPTWMPGGKTLVFDAAGPNLKLGVYRMAADGSGPPELVHELPANGHVTSVSPQGQASVMLNDPSTSTDVWLLDMNGDHQFRQFRRTPAMERQGSFSPDGRWLAYSSNESGRPEVYVEPVPGPGGRWQISSNGGEQPRWAHNGREIFYRSGTKMMGVKVETEAQFVAAKPVQLFDVDFDRGGAVAGYDVTPDGQSFLMVKSEQPSPKVIRVVIGWPRESH